MSEASKQLNSSAFLDKFRGKTNKIDKHGINSALQGQAKIDVLPNIRDRGKKRQSPKQEKEQKIKRVDLDELIPSNPQKKALLTPSKRITSHRLAPQQKLAYVPSLMTPSRENSLSPPSRAQSHSESTDGVKPKYSFGKYLKLDDQAINHFQFLMMIQKKSKEKQSKYSLIG